MDRPLLTPPPTTKMEEDVDERDDDHDGESRCPSRAWAWLVTRVSGTEHRQEYNHAHTVMMLKNVMTNLSLAMESVEEQRIKKLNEIRQMMMASQSQSASTREMARRALQTAKCTSSSASCGFTCEKTSSPSRLSSWRSNSR